MEELDWHTFPEDEEPTILTSTSRPCTDGHHEQCPGHERSEKHGGETIFCICPCHQAPRRA